ncbi:sodium/solute symporter [candidate division KSB1 bacterium]|nr:sodium/solute symporter [candidate division KSB1 bacterium]
MDLTMIIIVALYFILTLSIGILVSRREKNLVDDYFLAGRKLPWYAVSLSMTGSNIGTEHFIGMVGTAYVFGLAPATFEWGNFIPYSILLWIFLPYFFRKKLYTIPEFLERRYTPSTRAVFAGLSLLHMVFAVLTPALYAGGRILYDMTPSQPLVSFNWIYMGCVLIISIITAAYCIYGGLSSVVWTDVLQVTVLVVGGLVVVIFGLDKAGGLSQVIQQNLAADPGRFSLIQEISHPVSPWTGVATFWLTLSLWYVGTNQFYIQRCLGAKSEWDAKMGVIGCAGLKFFLPAIIVFPGLIAFVMFGPGLAEDAVYIKMINELLPPFGRGILLAALIAAIMSTVSSVLNSASTIWAIDVHKRLIHQKAGETELVRVGRWSTLFIIVIGTLMAPVLLFWKGGIFIYIQDMAAFFAPPIAVIFLAAFLWPGAHGKAATFTLIFGIVVGIGLKILAVSAGENGISRLQPLLNRAAITWVLCLFVLVCLSLFLPRHSRDRFDADIIWNPEWARLPKPEQGKNRGLRNLMFWWIVIISGSIALFIAFG